MAIFLLLLGTVALLLIFIGLIPYAIALFYLQPRLTKRHLYSLQAKIPRLEIFINPAWGELRKKALRSTIREHQIMPPEDVYSRWSFYGTLCRFVSHPKANQFFTPSELQDLKKYNLFFRMGTYMGITCAALMALWGILMHFFGNMH